MRLTGFLGRRLLTCTLQLAVRFRNVTTVPLRWPRLTTRRLIALVAIAAVLLWAVLYAPAMIERASVYQQKSETEDVLAKAFKVKEQASLARAMDLQADFDRLRRGTAKKDRLTENYFEKHIKFENLNSNYFKMMSIYHENLEPKYRRASWMPWTSVQRDPIPPPDPLVSQPFNYEPGKIYETITEGGGISVAFSPIGMTVAVGCRDGTVRLMEPLSDRTMASFSLPEGRPYSIAFSRDGTTLVGAGEAKFVQRWDLATGHAEQDLAWVGRVSSPADTWVMVTAVAVSPDGKSIAILAGGNQGKPPTSVHAVRLFDTQTGVLKWEHKPFGGWASSLAFSPDGEILASDDDGGAKLLETRTGRLKTTLNPEVGYVVAVTFSPDGRMLAGGGGTSKQAGTMRFGGSGQVTLWDVSTGTILRTLEGPTGRVQTIAFSPDGRTLAAGGTGPTKDGRDGFSGSRVKKTTSEVRLWDLATGRMMWTVEGESGATTSLDFSPDGRLLGFCDSDYVYLVDASDGKLRKVLMETTRKLVVRDRPPRKSRSEAEKP